jgi:predicted methyltransferase
MMATSFFCFNRGMDMRASMFVAAALVAAPLFGSALAADKISKPIAAAVADTSRPQADTDRDAARKPAEMLAFAGIKPGEKIIELLPGGGYFTRLLSVTVGPKGHIYALGFPPRPAPAGSSAPAMPNPLEVLAQDPHYPNITVMTIAAINSDPPTVPTGADLVWTSDNYHDLHNGPTADIAAFNKHVFAVLKSGGVFLIIDHVAAAGHGTSDTSTLHRIDPEAVKTEVEAAGFKLAGSSDAAHNPDDPHTAAVRDASIRFHTDEFALKFVKP